MQINYYSRYDPSTPACIVFAALYSIACVITVYQFIAYRCWFWIFMVIASIMEAAGYITRIVSIHNVYNLPLFIVQFLMIFLAPAIIAASCYMAMGRVVLHVTPMKYRTIKALWVTPRWMTPFFVACDVLGFAVQTIGGIASSSDDITKKKRGFDIMKIGLGIQLVCFGLFLVISFRFHVVSRRFRESWPDTRWISFLWALNVSCALIFIRSVYRMIEFSTGFNGYLATHEWNFYVFEAMVIYPVFILFIIFHPAKHVSNISFRQTKMDTTELHSRSGSDTEMQAGQPVRMGYGN